MRLLILGGSQFLGRAIATHGCAAGHDVTCAARGLAGPIAAGARFVMVDRDTVDGLAPLAGGTFDAVVDVSRHPGQVRRAAAALKRPGVHWTFVSTVSVYADNRTPGQRADTASLREPVTEDIEQSTDAIYGAAKVACEQAVGNDAFICRAGLIVGPEDPTGRFSYWPVRLARGSEVLAPGSPDDAVQFIDVRDLAQWIVHAAEVGLTGIYDGIGPVRTRGEFLAECASALNPSCKFTWIDRTFLEAHDIRRWAGPRSLPMWLPLPDFAGFMTRDTSPAREAGLTSRPPAVTARDTRSWLRRSNGPVVGLTEDEEKAVLAAWHAGKVG
ncbi:NAD-dependent epimerase/dehydratase family protein [Bradyrhizobium cajani]|uniref:NAD-dependent epimerase/dehydratase family protein n=1 Tax=Bradyrhizobium cajani TaxID=1928661 RepID=A0A844T004_9BRAD|nr:NAD-dependent epimerase/dehydratase family protein [Bradyrhizobium cajani]MCP3370881.1 NAD-dependent epimerase/dehydratase family protein [Bradyrhizobium cajani]MVT72087.1 NAD-dependent epimerase/dehydratase family protein [Bradyrhizobium cajani]